jgi:hypothetical protein
VSSRRIAIDAAPSTTGRSEVLSAP